MKNTSRYNNEFPAADSASVNKRLLPTVILLAGRAVVEDVLLQLHYLSFEQCIVLAGSNSEEIQALVNHNYEWGMTVNVMNYSRTKAQVLSEFTSMRDPSGLLIIEADKVVGQCVGVFLEAAESSKHSLLEASCANGDIGLTMLKSTS